MKVIKLNTQPQIAVPQQKQISKYMPIISIHYEEDEICYVLQAAATAIWALSPFIKLLHNPLPHLFFKTIIQLFPFLHWASIPLIRLYSEYLD